MINTEKTFYVAIAILSLIMGMSSFRMYSALLAYESIESAQTAYHEISSVMTYAVPLSFVVLIVFSNQIFLKTEKARYFFFSFLFFALFTVIDYVYIGEMYFHFIKDNGIWKGGFSVIGLAGLFLCFCAFVIAGANYVILVTIKKMMTPKK